MEPKINVYNSSIVKDKKYYIIVLPYVPDSVVERMFVSLYNDQNLRTSKNIFY